MADPAAQVRIDALREAAGWVAGFDQDQTGWAITFDRPTVRKMVQGLRAMADHAETRLSPSGSAGACCAQVAKTGVCYCQEDDRG